MTPGGVIGLVEWFRPGEYERVDRALEHLARLGIADLRTGISWADWAAPGGPAWYAWLLPRLAGRLHVLPCCHYTPPPLGLEPRTCAPPRETSLFAAFVREI